MPLSMKNKINNKKINHSSKIPEPLDSSPSCHPQKLHHPLLPHLSPFHFPHPNPTPQSPLSSSSTLNPHKSNELQEERDGQQLLKNRESSRLLASLPKLSSSLFASLPQPESSSTSSLFSALPQPTKTHNLDARAIPPAQSARKRVGVVPCRSDHTTLTER